MTLPESATAKPSKTVLWALEKLEQPQLHPQWLASSARLMVARPPQALEPLRNLERDRRSWSDASHRLRLRPLLLRPGERYRWWGRLFSHGRRRSGWWSAPDLSTPAW